MNAPATPRTPCWYMPRYTTRTRTKSGTTGSPRTCGSRDVSSTRATRATTGSAAALRIPLGFRGERGRVNLDGSPRHQHLFEVRHVHAGSQIRVLEEPMASLVDGGHPPDLATLGEDPVHARGHDHVADLDVLGALDELEAAAAVDGALDDPARARALHDRVDPAVVVGDEQHPGGMGTGEEDVPDDPERHQHRRPLADAVGLAAVDHQ